MTEFKLEWSEKCIKEYVDISVMGKTAAQKIPFIVCAGMLGVIFLGGIIMFAVTGLISSLIISVCALLFAGVAVLLINLLCKKLAEKVKKAAEGYNDIVAGVSDNDILFIKNNLPYGVMESYFKGRLLTYLRQERCCFGRAFRGTAGTWD